MILKIFPLFTFLLLLNINIICHNQRFLWVRDFAKTRKNKNKKKSIAKFSFFGEKNRQISRKKIEIVLPHLDCAFSLIAIFFVGKKITGHNIVKLLLKLTISLEVILTMILVNPISIVVWVNNLCKLLCYEKI